MIFFRTTASAFEIGLAWDVSTVGFVLLFSFTEIAVVIVVTRSDDVKRTTFFLNFEQGVIISTEVVLMFKKILFMHGCTYFEVL